MTVVDASSETVLRSVEMADTRLITGAALLTRLTIIKSSTFKDLNVFPAHDSDDTPPEAVVILTSSPSPSSFINLGCNTKSPLKLTLFTNVFT